MKALLSNYRQSPRKVRLLADLVRGKKVGDAITTLTHLPKRAAAPVKKLIESAVSNALSNSAAKKEDLYIKEINVDKGVVLKRMRPGARGRGYPIHKHTSHVRVVLDTHLTKKQSNHDA